MRTPDGHATAYVCRDFTCAAPVVEPEDLERQLRESAGPRLIQ
jgi:uncharacterized protein YyaL (SSP411 family)